ncbi:MAG: hemerythrin family protein [Gammaproteobacteria bacterium]|jgi:hemerythrin|nr:hemerythrin family protein [Gammaproteobacteria bacterium]MBT3721895.1 hemerythrin family protein [Gammaproteobacteria bacterium]MBT4075576.1 hemerythrin family protein [Gammaproteobacteria bacterium]MBT4196900.1 hemerythrin family protein [Gammaproteobacteria bacterium]MBT4451384.1 hemerythrin family protein [Gammaproteobacteria bacterium]
MTLSSLTPESIPLVSINFMNQTHLEEVDMVNALMDAIRAKQSGTQNDNEISSQLTEWLEHTKAHFARENELMQETGFPAMPVHVDEHEIAFNRMQTVVTAWEQNKDLDLLNDYVFTLWPNWFKAHVSSMDKITAEFALMNGFSED